MINSAAHVIPYFMVHTLYLVFCTVYMQCYDYCTLYKFVYTTGHMMYMSCWDYCTLYMFCMNCFTVHISSLIYCPLYSAHVLLGLLHTVHVLLGLLYSVHVSLELFYSAHILLDRLNSVQCTRLVVTTVHCTCLAGTTVNCTVYMSFWDYSTM